MLKDIKKKFSLSNNFFGDVVKLVSGTAVAQALLILASPILARFYEPNAFGLLEIFTSISSVLTVIISMRYELAIVLPKEDEDAANLFLLSFAISIIVTLLTIPIFIFLRSTLETWLNAPELGKYLWLMPIIVFSGGIGFGHPALNFWITRTKRFKELSISRVYGTLVTLFTQLGAILVGFRTTLGLVGGKVLGAVIAPLFLVRIIWSEDKKLFLRSISWQKMYEGLKRYKKFPLYGTWSAFLNTLSWQLPVFLLSSFFSVSTVGYYSLGFRVLQAPMKLIGDSVSNVFFQRAADAHASGELVPLVEDLFLKLVSISFFPLLMLSIIGKDLFVVIFGANWSEAGIYVQILSVWAFFWFISGPFSALFSVLEKQELQFKWNILTFFTRFLSLSVGGLLNDARLAVGLFSFTGVLVYGYKVYLNLWLAKASIKNALQILLKEVLFFLPFGAILLAGYGLGWNVYLLLGISILFIGGYEMFVLRRIINASA